MALARMDIPGLVYYGGTILPGRIGTREVSVQDIFEAIGAHAAGALDDAGLKAVESAVCPGAGACGGQFTANTMAMALAVMGLSPMGANDVPAVDPGKAAEGERCGRLIVERVFAGDTARKYITRASLKNAAAAVSASGGSTNAVMHLTAIAAEAGIAFGVEDCHQACAQTPVICDLKPGGRFLASHLFAAGGTRLVAQRQPALEVGHPGPQQMPLQGRPAGRRRCQHRKHGATSGCLALRVRRANAPWGAADWLFCRDGRWRPVEPGTFPLAHGAPARVGRLRAYGNAIVPQVAAAFIGALPDAAKEVNE
jgi:hypothetical protein